MQQRTLAPDPFGQVRRMGAYHARRRGLTRPDADGCALDFVQHCLECERPDRGQNSGGKCDSALLHECARHFAANRARDLGRRRHREVPLIEADGASGSEATTAQTPWPEREALQQAFWDLIEEDLLRLDPTPRGYVLRRYRDGESEHEIAASEGKSVRAVRMVLRRALKHLHDILLRQGHDYADLYEFLAPPPLLTTLSNQDVPH